MVAKNHSSGQVQSGIRQYNESGLEERKIWIIMRMKGIFRY